MRPTLRIEIEADATHARKKMVVLHLPDGGIEVLACDLKPHEAARLLIPLRKAVMAGIAWQREDSSAYILATHPNVTCTLEE